MATTKPSEDSTHRGSFDADSKEAIRLRGKYGFKHKRSCKTKTEVNMV